MVYVHIAEGFEEIEAITIVDILRRAELKVEMIGMSQLEVTGAHNITIHCDKTFEEADYSLCDMIVLPGGMDGTLHLMENKELGIQLQSFATMGRWIGAICAAPMILGRLGIMEEREGTIYPGMEEELKGAKVTPQPVAVAGKVITGQAPGSAMEFALELVEALKGAQKKKNIAEELCI